MAGDGISGGLDSDETLSGDSIGTGQELGDVRSRVLLLELQRVYEHLERNNEGALRVIQFIILAFGAALIAAAEVPEAFVAVPIFWTVWLLYSRLVNFNTLKLALYARYLEKQVNAALKSPVFFWESRATQRGNVRPFIFDLNYAYWAVLSAASWTGGVAVLLVHDRYVWAVVLASGGIVLMATAIRDYRQRESVIDRLRMEIDQGPRAADRPVVVATDTSHLLFPVAPVIIAIMSGAIAISITTDDPMTTRLTIGLIAVGTIAIGSLIIWRRPTYGAAGDVEAMAPTATVPDR
jgi:hypothetical protein